MALTIHIEAGFQDNLETSAVFVDLTVAYDTVPTNLHFTYQSVPYKQTLQFIDNMLTGRVFRVTLGSKTSSSRTDGLPDGSVLAPLLFNLYIQIYPKPEFLNLDTETFSSNFIHIVQTIMKQLNIYIFNYQFNKISLHQLACVLLKIAGLIHKLSSNIGVSTKTDFSRNVSVSVFPGEIF